MSTEGQTRHADKPPRGASSGWKKKLLLVLIAPLLFLALGELVLRITGYGCPPRHGFEGDMYDHHNQQVDDRFWKLKPGSADWQVNASGFRDTTPGKVPKQKPAGEFRIAFLGDSATFGWRGRDDGVVMKARQAYPHQVQRLLNRLPNRKLRYRCLNFSVPGYSSYQGRVQLRGQVLAFEPDLVIPYFAANDAGRAYVSDSERAQLFWINRRLRYLRVYQLQTCLMRRLRHSDKRADHPEDWLPRTDKTRVSMDEFLANHADMARAAREAGARLALMAYIFYEEEYRRVVTYPERDARPELGPRYPPGKVPLIDVSGAVGRALGSVREAYFDNCHPTEAIHAVMAAEIVRQLRAKKLIPDH